MGLPFECTSEISPAPVVSCSLNLNSSQSSYRACALTSNLLRIYPRRSPSGIACYVFPSRLCRPRPQSSMVFISLSFSTSILPP